MAPEERLEIVLRSFQDKYGEMVEKVLSQLEELKTDEEWKHEAFQEKWGQVIKAGKAVRKERDHVSAGVKTLIRMEWGTQDFFDLIVIPWLKPTRTTFTKLKIVAGAGIEPLEALQRACQRMVERLEEKHYNEGTLHPTDTDLERGLDLKREPLTQERVLNLGKVALIFDEQFGLVWENKRPEGAAGSLRGVSGSSSTLIYIYTQSAHGGT